MKLLDIVFVKMRISQMSKNIILNCKKNKRFNNVMDIEQAATGYLKQYIARATYLKAIINDNDKEPFFDGSILIYNNNNFINENYVGSIRIQIKGKVVTTFEKNQTIKYQVKISDLKGYLKSDGCIFFVICVSDKINETKGYFITLKPLFIKVLLNAKKSNKKTITVSLQELPQNIVTFTNIVRNTYNDCRLQRNQIERKVISDTALEKLTNKGYKIISSLIQSDDKIDYDFLYNYKHNFYLKSPDGKEIISIENLNSILSITKHMDIEIWVGDKKYYDSYDVEEHDAEDYIFIGRTTKLIINKNEHSITINIDFNNAIYFNDYIKDMQFVIDMLNNKNIKFVNTITKNTFNIPIDERFQSTNTIDVALLNEKLNYLIDVDDALKLIGLNIDEKLLIKNLSVTDENNIKILVDNLIYNKLYNQKKDKFSPLCYMDINNISLMLYLEKNKSGVKIYNPANNRFVVVMKYDDNRPDKKVSPYLWLESDKIAKISNFDFDDIYQSLISIGDSESTNRFIIKLIEAYDICKKEKLLNLANRLSQWIVSNETNNELWHCAKLNQLQAKLRINSIGDDDQDYLNTIIYNDNYSINLKLGACLLTKNKHKFQLLFDKLDFKEKEEFIKYPIYKYFYPLCK